MCDERGVTCETMMACCRWFCCERRGEGGPGTCDLDEGRRSTIMEERWDWDGGIWARKTGLLGTETGSGSGWTLTMHILGIEAAPNLLLLSSKYQIFLPVNRRSHGFSLIFK